MDGLEEDGQHGQPEQVGQREDALGDARRAVLVRVDAVQQVVEEVQVLQRRRLRHHRQRLQQKVHVLLRLRAGLGERSRRGFREWGSWGIFRTVRVCDAFRVFGSLKVFRVFGVLRTNGVFRAFRSFRVFGSFVIFRSLKTIGAFRAFEAYEAFGAFGALQACAVEQCFKAAHGWEETGCVWRCEQPLLHGLQKLGKARRAEIGRAAAESQPEAPRAQLLQLQRLEVRRRARLLRADGRLESGERGQRGGIRRAGRAVLAGTENGPSLGGLRGVWMG